MKANKIWIVIALILAGGIWSTSSVKEYVGNAPMTAVYETTAAVPETAGAEKTEAPVLTEAESEVPATPVAAAEAKAETAAAAAAPSAAEDQAAGRLMKAAPESSETGTEANRYRERLEDLDEQIAKNRAASGDTTANSLKAAAENERKLWEAELNRILDALEQAFSAEQEEAFFTEQKEWIRERENQAVAASKKQSGSAMEEVEYNLSLAEITRARSYELVQQYAAVLTETD